MCRSAPECHTDCHAPEHQTQDNPRAAEVLRRSRHWFHWAADLIEDLNQLLELLDRELVRLPEFGARCGIGKLSARQNTAASRFSRASLTWGSASPIHFVRRTARATGSSPEISGNVEAAATISMMS